MALWPCVASVPQLAGDGAAVVDLVAIALRPLRSAAGTESGTPTNHLLVGGTARVAGADFVEFPRLPRRVPAWVVVLGFLLLCAVVIALVRSWSTRPGQAARSGWPSRAWPC